MRIKNNEDKVRIRNSKKYLRDKKVRQIKN